MGFSWVRGDIIADGAYKKLAKKSDFSCNPLSSIDIKQSQGKSGIMQNGGSVNSIQMANLGTKKEPMSPTDTGSKTNTPERTRTSDLRFRKPMLYPAELRAQQ